MNGTNGQKDSLKPRPSSPGLETNRKKDRLIDTWTDPPPLGSRLTQRKTADRHMDRPSSPGLKTNRKKDRLTDTWTDPPLGSRLTERKTD